MGSSACYDEHKPALDQFWAHMTASFPRDDNDCWEHAGAANVEGFQLEKTEDGYNRARWLVPKVGADGQPVKRARKVSGNRTSMCQVYTKHTMYLHHLAKLCKNRPLYKSRLHDTPSGRKWIPYTVSHRCSNPACFRPSHLIVEPHRVNISRQRCPGGELCPHVPRCLVPPINDAYQRLIRALGKPVE
jgi:hypothetical protein